MSHQDPADEVVAWLWERSDGTRAGVVENPVAPHWELRVTKNGRTVARARVDSFADLIEASTAARRAADGIKRWELRIKNSRHAVTLHGANDVSRILNS
jgi:uncharacterized membrane protein